MKSAKIVLFVFVLGFFSISTASAQNAVPPDPDSRQCSVTRRQNVANAAEMGCFRDAPSAYTLGLFDGIELMQERQRAAPPNPDQTLAELDARQAERRLRDVSECISRAQAYVFNPSLAQTLYSSLARCERLANGQNY